MLAKKEGASLVVVSETNPSRGQKAVDLGVADEWLDVRDEANIKTMMTKVGEGFDKVIECCGNAPAVTSALSLVKTGGEVVLVGVSLGPISVPTVLAVMHELTKEEFATCIDLIANKQIDVLPFLSEIVSLNEVQASFDKLLSGTSDAIKILVDLEK